MSFWHILFIVLVGLWILKIFGFWVALVGVYVLFRILRPSDAVR